MNFPMPIAPPSISFEGVGELRTGNRGLGQAPATVHCDATGKVSIWITQPTPQLRLAGSSEYEFELIGTLIDGRPFKCSALRAVSLPNGEVPIDSIGFRAGKFVIGQEYAGGEATFLVTNLLLPNFSAENQAVTTTFNNDVEVALVPDTTYAERMKHLRAYRGIDVTTTLTLRPRDAEHDVRDLASELRIIFSVITGQKVNWIGMLYGDSITFENRVTKPFSGWPVVGWREEVFAGISDWAKLLQQAAEAVPHFRRHAQRYRLPGLINTWIDARTETDFLESRCLKMAGVLEAIKDAYRASHKVRKTLGEDINGVCKDVGIVIPPTDLSYMLSIRNSIVHEGTFIEPHTLSKVDQYEVVSRHTARIIVALVGIRLAP